MKYQRVKNGSCSFMLIPWLVTVVGALVLGEPDNFSLAKTIGNALWIWPIASIFISWVGTFLHMLFGLWDSDPTPEQEFIHQRRAQSFKLFACLSLCVLGLVIATLFRNPIEGGILGPTILSGILEAVGMICFIICFFASLSVDSFTLSEQDRMANQLPGVYGRE